VWTCLNKGTHEEALHHSRSTSDSGPAAWDGHGPTGCVKGVAGFVGTKLAVERSPKSTGRPLSLLTTASLPETMADLLH
jgi:hypothetical protein